MEISALKRFIRRLKKLQNDHQKVKKEAEKSSLFLSSLQIFAKKYDIMIKKQEKRKP